MANLLEMETEKLLIVLPGLLAIVSYYIHHNKAWILQKLKTRFGSSEPLPKELLEPDILRISGLASICIWLIFGYLTFALFAFLGIAGSILLLLITHFTLRMNVASRRPVWDWLERNLSSKLSDSRDFTEREKLSRLIVHLRLLRRELESD